MNLRAVVAATDLSAPARRAVERAARLAATAGASLTLVHAVNAPLLAELRRWIDAGGDAERSIADDLRARLHELAAASRNTPSFTMAAECKYAEIAVGAVIACGSQK